jgi:taurine dioxygenase
MRTVDTPATGRLKIRRLGYALGAEITGVDFRQPLDDGLVDEIRRAWLDHVVLCFPGQNLDAEQMRAFCRQFGELDENRGSVQQHPNFNQVLLLASKPVQIDGKPTSGNARADVWHSDASYTVRPSTITFLVAKALPEVGGNTMFANMSMAYETLSVAFQKLIEPLSGVHDVTIAPFYKAISNDKQAKMARNPPVVHSAVLVHPETGRKALYVSDRVEKFIGMSEEESRPILDVLVRHATRYEFIYRHRWTVHDLLMWDNRSALHYGPNDYDRSQLRHMLRCSLVGPEIGHVYQPQG